MNNEFEALLKEYKNNTFTTKDDYDKLCSELLKLMDTTWNQ